MKFLKFNRVFYLVFIVPILMSFSGKSLNQPKLSVRNWTKQEYQAASQNWSVAYDSKGFLYMANNSGMLEFDGISWNLYPSPDGAIIRTVIVDSQDRIFSAGYRELGYWERVPTGKLEYHSLKKDVEQFFTTNEEFWNVIAQDNKVYFQSFSKVYIYDYTQFQICTPSGFVNSISSAHDMLLVNIMNQGIYRLEGNKTVPYLLDQAFNQQEIRFALPFGERDILVGTGNDGLWVFDGLSMKRWLPEQTAYFRENMINRGCISGDGKIVIGTILDGVSVFDLQGNLLCRLNKENGLQNNTVLGLICDRNNNLWLSLDKGIDFISFNPDPSYSITERKELGAVYDAAIYREQLYLATNQGLFHRPVNDQAKPFVLVPETQGQIWDCAVIDDRLFVNHNRGTYEINGSTIRKISNVSGGFSIIENPHTPGTLAQSTYSNLVFYRKNNNAWQVDKVNYQVNDLIRYLETDHLGNFWAGHMYRGIFRLKFNKNDSLTYRRYYGAEVFGKDHNIHVFKVENRIVFTTGEKFYTYDDLRDSVIVYSALNEKTGLYAGSGRIVAAPEHHYWFIGDTGCALFKIQGLEVKKIREFPNSLFNNQLVKGYENIYPIDEYRAILCLENGYALLNAKAGDHASNISGRKPELARLTAGNNSGQLDEWPVSLTTFELRFNRNNVHFTYSFPYFSTEKITYQSFVEGLDQRWSDGTDTPDFAYKRIPAGQYKVKVRAVNNWGEYSLENELRLTILPPWYLSKLAYIFYLIAIFLSLMAFRRLIIRKTKLKEKRKSEDRERELVMLRNEKLQADLSFKSKELANSTMSIIKKNEFLMEIKRILRNQKAQLGSRYPDKYYDHLVEKIDGNMSSKDDWKIFETNFERAHEQFAQTMKTQYPDLTPSDLRLCAFLRMNLSSKEIAPLLGISVRGVENHRYRLRKKLGLPADGNLTEFIIGV